MRASARPVRSRSPLAVALVGLAIGLLSPSRAAAQPPPDPAPAPAPPSAADREAAQRAFSQGQHAFKRGDFRHAAEQFEVAYAHAPHPDVLWNAARAWHRARELARAANLYARFLRDAPADARDRNSATSELRELSTKVARMDVVAPDFQDVRVDEQPLEGTTVYVTPGAHVVEGRFDGRPVRQTPTVAAGDVVSIALVAPAAAAPVVAQAPAATTSPAGASKDGGKDGKDAGVTTASHGLPPAVVYAGAAATVVATGFTIWSAVDTEQARSHYDGSQQALSDGLGKERRTNVLVVVSGGLGGLTLLSMLLLVDWHKHPSSEKQSAKEKPADATVKVGVGPGSFVVGGSF
jgi:hypothetical protein